MLAHDPTIAWLDRRHLENWWALLLPPGLSSSRFALLVLGQGVLLHAIRLGVRCRTPDHSAVGAKHSRSAKQGALKTDANSFGTSFLGEGAVELSEVPFEGTSKAALAKLRTTLNVHGLLVLERRALVDLFEAMERTLQLQDDYATQGARLWQELRRSEGIWTSPSVLELIPPLRLPALQKTFDLLVPGQSTLVAYVLDGRHVHASVIAEKRQGSIELVTMHPAIGDLLSEQELAGDWRSHYDRVNQAVSARFSKPSISVFVERDAVLRILRGPADQLSKELRAKNLIVDPSPLWLQGVLGGAAALSMATDNAKRMARFLPKSARRMAGDLAAAAQSRVKESSANPFATLGFDPLELLQSLRGFYSTR